MRAMRSGLRYGSTTTDVPTCTRWVTPANAARVMNGS